MGPLFSLALLVIAAVALAAATFTTARAFRLSRPLLVALAFSVGAVAGGGISVLLAALVIGVGPTLTGLQPLGYRHFLIVDDPAWTPHADTAARVDAVLRRWLLVDEVEQCLDLTRGALNPIDAADLASIKAGAGVAVVYAGIAGEPVMRIAGASLYNDIDPRDRYTMRTSLVLGDDFRIPWSSDGVWFELISPPTIAGQPVPANESDDEPGPDLLYERSFPSEGASPPVVKVHVQDGAKENIAWDHIQGYWRAALVIDFGKDLPSFCEGVQALPARDFVTDVADAFRSRLVEIGEFY